MIWLIPISTCNQHLLQAGRWRKGIGSHNPWIPRILYSVYPGSWQTGLTAHHKNNPPVYSIGKAQHQGCQTAWGHASYPQQMRWLSVTINKTEITFHFMGLTTEGLRVEIHRVTELASSEAQIFYQQHKNILTQGPWHSYSSSLCFNRLLNSPYKLQNV